MNAAIHTRAQYDSALKRASAGDESALQMLPTLAHRLLEEGRHEFASSPEFQDLFAQVNNDLAHVLEQQALTSHSIIALWPSYEDTIAQLKALRAELKAGLDKLNGAPKP